MVNEQDFRKISQRLVAMEKAMVEFQKSITAIPALSPVNDGEGEWDRAIYIKQFLQDQGVTDIVEINAPDPDAKQGVRPNLIARIKGHSDEKTIWLMAHMDVVPEGDLKLWETNPWEAVVNDGKIFGRGVEDNQQGLTSSVFTLLAFLKEGIRPAYDLAVILVADEETGSDYGLGYIMEHHAELFRKSDLIIVPDAGEPDSTMIEVAEKSIAWFRFRTLGKQCHGSLPEQGINAFYAASHLVTRLHALYEIFDAENPVFAPPISTFEATRKEANVPNINTIPGEDVFYMDCRLLPQYTIEALFAEVRRICDTVEEDFSVKIEFETRQLAPAAPPTPNDAEVVEKLARGIKNVYRVNARPMGIGGGTVAAVFRRHGLEAAVWSTLADTCHQPNEFCVIDYMVNDARVFAHVCLQQ